MRNPARLLPPFWQHKRAGRCRVLAERRQIGAHPIAADISGVDIAEGRELASPHALTASALAGAVVFLEEVYTYRHQLRFVLRFGVRGQFTEFIYKLNDEETARGWARPRVWQAINGLVNEKVVIRCFCVSAFGELRRLVLRGETVRIGFR